MNQYKAELVQQAEMKEIKCNLLFCKCKKATGLSTPRLQLHLLIQRFFLCLVV